MIIQNEPVSDDQKADLSFTVAPDDLRAASDVLEPLDVGEAIETDERIGKVSIVGAGMRSHPGVAAKVFRTLGDEWDQHRDDLHLADQDLLRDRRRRVPDAVTGAARGVRARRRRGPRGGPGRRAPPAARPDSR